LGTYTFIMTTMGCPSVAHVQQKKPQKRPLSNLNTGSLCCTQCYR